MANSDKCLNLFYFQSLNTGHYYFHFIIMALLGFSFVTQVGLDFHCHEITNLITNFIA